jgi:hypothetical protein
MTIPYGYLKDYFDSFGFKLLKPVEIDPAISNEHEFNGIDIFKEIFGPEKQHLPCRVIYLTDDEDNIIEDMVTLTWYDARERHPTRTEYRLYYPKSDCFMRAKPDDLLIICKNRNDIKVPFTMFISKHGDTMTNQLLWLFGISLDELAPTWVVEKITASNRLNYFSSLILSKIGIVLKEPDDSLINKLFKEFPNGFPTTVDFSEFSRTFISDVSLYDDPDSALVKYLENEEYLFRVFENHFIKEKLKTGFLDTDDFIRFSLSVHNRRKSRAGYALENHLKFIFSSLEILYSYNEITENKSRPDFIFPGISDYKNMNFSPLNLTMLGAKTTCKDRWRQVLTEAKRIPEKHLVTLEPSISEDQTDEMKANRLGLVIPATILPTYKQSQQSWLMTISDFVGLVRKRQNAR